MAFYQPPGSARHRFPRIQWLLYPRPVGLIRLVSVVVPRISILLIGFLILSTLTKPTSPLKNLDDIELYATCGTGLEDLLVEEFRELGFDSIQSAGAGVRFRGGLHAGYKACLWSRIANRILLPIHSGPAASPEALYELVQEIDWSEHVDVDGTLAVDFFTAKSAITHSQYGALKVKDAVVDQFRDAQGRRPNVERETPDLRINVYLFRDKARIAIDLSGSSLHRRGYRDAQGLAPLKENLAAALLYAAGWPAAMKRGTAFVDPMCGSGTLLIEAAMIACQHAPGLHRNYFGFEGWKGHDEHLWETLKVDAIQGQRDCKVLIAGSDQDAQAIDNCQHNIAQAGLENVIHLDQLAVSDGRHKALGESVEGLLVTNPPYGERLAADTRFYADLGANLSRYYAGWQCALFTATAAPFQRARLPLATTLHVKNGGIDCVLLTGSVPKSGLGKRSFVDDPRLADESRLADEPSLADESGATSVYESAAEQIETGGEDSDANHPQASLYRSAHSSGEPQRSAGEIEVDATDFINRLKKNQKALKGWVRQNDIHAYRLYDSDLPEFAVAIDIYRGDTTHCVVQEYQAPATVNVAMAQARLKAIMEVVPEFLGISPEDVHLKVREVQTGLQQYEKQDSARSKTTMVPEFGATLEVNFTDYLDTGLFLDHRPVRRHLYKQAEGKRFLNLFAYTATATIAALAGGASSSVSVDTSNRYCQWARRNLDRNEAALQNHEVVRQDVMAWLRDAAVGIRAESMFDLILLDPPTFSNSSSLDDDWNVQRDHVAAIDACLKVLSPGGTLIFSNNFRRFKLDASLSEDSERGIRIEDKSRWSIDRDFQRNPRIHQCWFIHKIAK
ncbi:MAG: 23S rRNA (guanine2445-N2)-methyltransferase / 23S rRNA (guanine2069-N7)-methyltransferase [Granulosicoccus sp.]|jgi:23S rRNA (guanine2445-N2)-methyltransferase / 23S rRNA (guanine2069-N7)-methyltransferase